MNTIEWFDTRNCCPACGSQSFTQLFSISFSDSRIRKHLETFYAKYGFIEYSYLEGVDYILGQCSVCSLIFQIIIPNDTLMKILYDEWINPLKVFDLVDGKRDVEYFLSHSKQIANIIHHFGGRPQELVFLDFGMGWGQWCKLAKSYDCKVFGHELSVSRTQHAKREGIPILNWDEISQTKFDFINTDQVFEHLSSPLETLKHLKMSLKPKGVIRIYVPDASRVERKLEQFLVGKIGFEKINEIAPLEHINGFNNKSIKIMALRAGLRDINVIPKYINSLADFLDEKVRRPLYRSIGQRGTDVYLTAE